MRIIHLDKLANLLLFSKESLRQLEPGINTLNFNLKYWIKKKVVIRLKRGLFLLRNRWEKENNKKEYREYLANKIYEPSYLSCEYVLTQYALLTEAVYTVTSISTKKTKSFENDLGRFNYYSISPKLFTGFEIQKFNSAPVLIAKKEKAVFDFLYLRFLKTTQIDLPAIKELRLNWENISRAEFNKIQKYVTLTKSRRLEKMMDLIHNNYYA